MHFENSPSTVWFTSSLRRFLGGLLAMAAIFASPAEAATYTWNGALNATWDTSSTNWNGASGTPWDSTSGTTNAAVFNTASGTYNVASIYTNALTFSAATQLKSGTINLGGASPTITASVAATIGSSLVANNLTIAANWGGATSLTLTGSNNLTGTVNITSNQSNYAFVLLNSTYASLGSANWVVGNSSTSTDGAGLYFQIGTGTIANSFTLNGNAGGGRGRLLFNNGNVTITGSITSNGTAAIYSNAGNSTLSLNGVISGTGLFLGSGNNNANYSTIVLGTANTFTGGLTISQNATVQLSNAGALNSTPGSENAVSFYSSGTTGTFYNGGILSLNGNSVVVANLTSAASMNPSYVNVVRNAAASAAQLTVGNSQNLSGTFAGNIQDGTGGGTLSLVKAGSGTFTLSGSNTYTGRTTINLGQLALASANALGTGTATVSGGVLNIATYAPAVAGFTITSGSLTGSGTLTATNGYALQGGAVNAALGTGAITVSSGTTTLGSAGRLNSASSLTIQSGQLTLGGNESVASYTQSGGTLGGSGTVTAATYALNGGSVNANIGNGSITASSGTTTLVGGLAATSITISGGRIVLGSSDRLASTGTVSISSGSLDTGSGYSNSLGSFTLSGGSLLGSGTITSASGYAVQGGTLNAALGTGAITFSTGATTLGSAGRFNSASTLTGSSGQLTLGGNEQVTSFTLVGGTLAGTGKTLTAGTYALQGGVVSANLGAGTINVTSGTTTLSGTAAGSAINVSSGALALGGSGLLSNSGTLTVSGGIFDTTSSNYTATVGTFNISSGSLTGSGTITATNGYALQGGAVNAVLGNGAITVSSGTTTLGSAGRFNSASGLTIQSGQLTLGGNESVASFTLAGGILGGSGNTLSSAGAYDVRAGSVLANLGGSVALTKSTTGTVTLSGSNSYSGGTQISNGTLQLGSNTALPTSSALTLGTGSTSGVLVMNSNIATLRAITFNGSGSQLGTGTGGKLNLLASGTNNATITVTSGSHILHPDTTLQSNTVIDVASSAIFTLHGVIDGTKSLTKLGSGTLAIDGANSYSGGSFLSGGYVSALSTGALGSGTVTIDGNTILNLNNTILSNTVVFGSGSGAVINSGTLVNVTGTYSITSGTGSSITTNYSVLSGGDISFVNNLASTVEVQSGALGTFTADVLAGTPDGTVIVNAGGRGILSGSVLGSVTTSGSSLFSGSVLGNVTVGGGTASFSGPTGAASAVNANGGLAVFTGTIGGIAHATAAGATVEIRSRVLNTADVNAEAGGTVKLMGSEAFDATTIDNDGSVIVDRTANLALAAVISGSGSLTKLNATTLTLTGANTFSGATAISGGRLTVDSAGSLNGTSGITLNGGDFKYNSATTLAPSITFAGAGGTLSGTGTIGSAVTVGTNAILSPGNSPGTQAFMSGLAWNPGGTYVWELNSLAGTAGTNWDLLNVSGGTFDISALSAASKFNLNLVTLNGSNAAGPLDSGYVAGSSYELLITSFATLGSGTSNFGANSDLTSLFNISLTGWQGPQPSLSDISVRVNSAGNGIQLVIVPEPGTIVFAGFGIVVVGWMAWRRRESASK